MLKKPNKTMKVPEGSIALKIDYEKGSDSPERIFDAMSGLIKSTRVADRALLSGLDGSVKTTLLLEDIETGSLVGIVRSVLENTDDEALKSGDVKKVVGHYLYAAKCAFLEHFPEKKEDLNKSTMRVIQAKVKEVAETTGASELPFYQPPSIIDVVETIDAYQQSAAHLKKGESISMLDQKGAPINIPQIEGYSKSDTIEALKERELSNDVKVMLGVKKPDYLGRSKWSFIYDGKNIEASILHKGWLSNFQNREIDVRPGDSLYALLKISTTYGNGSNILSTKYEVLDVIAVEKLPPENLLL